MVEQPLALGRRRGAGKARPAAAAGIGGQGELGDQQQAAADVLQGQIHALLAVGEHPVLQQSLKHATAGGLVIRRFDTHQDQQARAYGADRMALDLDAGAADPLQQRLHSASWGRSSSWRAIWSVARTRASQIPGSLAA